MKSGSLAHIFKNFLIVTVSSVSLLVSMTTNSYAITDYVRKIENVTDANAGYCKIEDLEFLNLDSGDDTSDMEWEMDNPVCIGFGLGAGLQYKIATTVAYFACVDPAGGAEAIADFATGKWISAKFPKKLAAKLAPKCASYAGTGAWGMAAACCGGVAASGISLGIAMAELGAIYKAAVDSESNAHVCGAGWNRWESRPAAKQSEDDLEGIAGYEEGGLPNNEVYVHGAKTGSYQKYLRDKYATGAMTLAITNKEYREYIYGGKEFEDRGDGACRNPEKWSASRKTEILGFSTTNQRYYMRGPATASNYACGRFLLFRGTNDEKNSAKAAYECCKQRSQSTICIEERSTVTNTTAHKFCEIGHRCTVQYVMYSIGESKRVANYACAETYSVCPFNHKLGGGTEIIQNAPKSDTPGEVLPDNRYKVILNHCQYLKHCVKRPDIPYIRTSNLDGGWLSSACFDLKGDSQNEYEYSGSLTPINKTKNFSAPIAQCFKETLENMFINKAGNSKCLNPDDFPDSQGNCSSGYIYKAGDTLVGASFFQTIQDRLRTAIKLAMTIAVTIGGFAVLLSGTPWNKKTIMMFVVKLSLVAYFVLGTAWQDFFFQGVSSVSTGIAEIFMKLDEGKPADQLDGCQFPKFNYAFDATSLNGSKYDIPAYPIGKEYLKIWDTLDCKIARALGFGPEVSVPNLAIMIVVGLISNGLGLIFFVATFIFAFYMLALTIRALHIFLISSMAITILIYISPITITAVLFKKTEGMFKSWRTNLLSFILQPIILFTYLGIVIVVFDHIMVGDARFTGDGRSAPKQIDCSYDDPKTTGNAGENSIYCIFNIASLQNNNSLAPLGIAIATLFNMNQIKLNTIIKAAFLMFIFAKFIDKILELATKMLGGATLTSESMSAGAALGKAYGVAGAIQSRGTRGLRSWGETVAKKVAAPLASRAAKAITSAPNAVRSLMKDYAFGKKMAENKKHATGVAEGKAPRKPVIRLGGGDDGPANTSG